MILKPFLSSNLKKVFETLFPHRTQNLIFNLSFAKPFGTHLLPGGSAGSPCYLKNRCPHEHEIVYGIRDIFERPGNGKVSYIVINWLP